MAPSGATVAAAGIPVMLSAILYSRIKNKAEKPRSREAHPSVLLFLQDPLLS